MFGLRSSGSVHKILPKVRKVRSSICRSSGCSGFGPTLVWVLLLPELWPNLGAKSRATAVSMWRLCFRKLRHSAATVSTTACLKVGARAGCQIFTIKTFEWVTLYSFQDTRLVRAEFLKEVRTTPLRGLQSNILSARTLVNAFKCRGYKANLIDPL